MKTEGTRMRVMLIDDSAQRLESTRRILGPNFSVVGESDASASAVALAREVKPEVILVSVEEPVAPALSTIESLSVVLPGVPIVALSTLGERAQMRQAVLAGARDYVVQPVESEELTRVISDVHDVELKRTELSGHFSGREQHGQVLTVYGVKGGIGRTMLATNLAVALAMAQQEDLEHRRRVALVDLDLQFGDACLMLNITPERTISELMPIADKLDGELIRSFLSFHCSGLQVLAAPSTPGEGEQISGAHVRRILEVLSQAFDYVVVDTPRHLTDGVIAALDAASLILLLASNDVACLKNTRLFLSMCGKWGYSPDKLKLVLNEAHKRDGVPMHDAEASLEYPIFAQLPHDGPLVASGTWGKPFVAAQPHAHLSEAVGHLAFKLGGAPAKHSRSLFAKLRG